MEKPDYLKTEQVKTQWGEDFAALAENSRVHFTADRLIIDLSDLTGPIVTDEGSTQQVRIKRPKVKELRMTDAEKGEIAKSVLLLKACAGLPMASIDNMDGADFVLCQQAIGLFLADGQ